MIKAVIFDLNGVFLQSEHLSDRMQERYGVSSEAFVTALKEVMKEARKPGVGDSFLLWKPHLEKLGLKLTKEEFFNFWFSGEKIVPELLEYARELRKSGVKVVILSNNFRERTNYYRQRFPELFSDLDGAYFSWETGYVKPDPEAYKHLMKEQDLMPGQCVYFDDSDENIAVTKELGIESFKYEGLNTTKEHLEGLGVSTRGTERE